MSKPGVDRSWKRKLVLLLMPLLMLGSASRWVSAQDALTPCKRLGRWHQCITVPLASPQRDAEAKQFQPPAPNRAKIYVVRPGTVKPLARSSILLGGVPVTELAPMTYAVLDSAPGRQRIEIGPADGAGLVLDLEPGQIRYVGYCLGLLFNTISGSVTALDATEGQALVLKSKLVEGVAPAD